MTRKEAGCHCSMSMPLENICAKNIIRGYVCTEPKGHSGPHIACGILKDSHGLVTSENIQTLQETEI